MKPMKFDFDTEFDENGEILREGESYKRFFTQDDVDAARMWGVEEGREMEEGRCADALQAVASQMQLILARLAGESEALRQSAAMLAIAAARKIAGAALESIRLRQSTSWPPKRSPICARNRNSRFAAIRNWSRNSPNVSRKPRAMPVSTARSWFAARMG